MANQNSTLLMVAPNGARRTKRDHPGLPMTADEIAGEALLCRDAGAAALHLHVRSPTGEHSLDADIYRDAIKAVHETTGGDMVIQITTEAVGMYRPDEQMAAVKALRPEFVSLALREIIPDPQDEAVAADFFAWMRAEKIIPQFILYDAGDMRKLADFCARGIIPASNPFVLYVLGRYAKDQTSAPEDLMPFLRAAHNYTWPWMVCAFGAHEAACIGRGIELGGHGRIGFENNLYMPDGTIAPDNAALVKVAADKVRDHNREVMTPDQFRDMMETFW
ncbi:MAG: 3-keto-5-aminohexanoate cleavage protein [Fimbriimonadaceae bacterium]|nr:3-keto-5-aminohexanoate cleavage protein [Alphaproteobacteria bacterium]